MLKQQANTQYLRIESEAHSQIEILQTQIKYAREKYQEAVAKSEPEPVMNAIQKSISFFNEQINRIANQLKKREETGN